MTSAVGLNAAALDALAKASIRKPTGYPESYSETIVRLVKERELLRHACQTVAAYLIEPVTQFRENRAFAEKVVTDALAATERTYLHV